MRLPASIPLLFLTIVLQAQTTFAPVGATWTYDVYNPWGGSISPVSFTATGDTVIHDVTCQRIDLGGQVPCTYFHFQGSYPHLFTCTSGDSVFWFDRISDTFRLLAPFDAQPGSSWQITLPSDMGDPSVSDIAQFTVTAVQTIDVDGQALRRLRVSQAFITNNGYLRFPTGTGTFTERLGHEFFMIPWLMQCADAPTPTSLTCYSDPDMSWPDPDTPCGTTTGIADQAHEATWSVTPTLIEAGQAIRVSATTPSSTRAHWQVTDVLGRKLQEGAFQGSSQALMLERSGTFLITVWTDRGEVLSQRVVVR